MKLTEETKEIINLGNIIVGATVGTVMSMNSATPEALVASSAIGGLLPQVLNDFSSRVLSKREKIKVGAVTQFAINRINENLNNGKIINLDFIKKIDENNWTSANELYEGVLIKARNEAQEKKIKHIGAIFGNSVFVKDISSEDVNHLLSVVDSLTFRKLCIISLYGKKNELFDKYNIMIDAYIWYPDIIFPLSTIAVLQDILELGNLGIIDLNSMLATINTHLTPAKFKLTELGQKYFELMSLHEINLEELNNIIESIEYKKSYGISDQGNINGIKP
jgi:hypothetical protein